MKKKYVTGLLATTIVFMITVTEVGATTKIQLSTGATADVSYDNRAQSIYEAKIGIQSGYTQTAGTDVEFMNQLILSSLSSARPQGAAVSDATPVLNEDEQAVLKEAAGAVAEENVASEISVVETTETTVSEAGTTVEGTSSEAAVTENTEDGTAEVYEEVSADAATEAVPVEETEGKTSDIILSIGDANFVSTVPEEYQDEFDPEELNNGASYGYTNIGIAQVEDHLNVRSAVDGGKIVGKMGNNAGCEILDIVGDKAHIVSGSVEGYVAMEYLITGSAAVAYADGIVENLATVSANGLRVRAEANGESEVLGMVAYGEELPALTEEAVDGWVKVSYDGKEGYVNAEYVRVGRNLKTALNMTEFLYGEGVSDVRVDLCEYAKQFLGNRYVWGGTSLTNGCDCSGFTMQILGRYGVGLPHSSRAQAQMGTKISMSEAKPGDLVFYSKGGRINHVAIYIGGGQVIHASSPKTGIRITSAYYRTPTTVRRFLSDSV
ncbi:MAG: C40 family peptidase [Lachnospiraceae bacterium]|nr:C40 family peptidase [Lachnospiraceae bacterium]